jgi:hypothetical protein
VKTLAELEQRLKELTDEIREAKDRLPAHSVKQPVMMALLDLEDEYDLIVKQISDLKKGD